MTDQLSLEEVNEYRTAFNLLDKGKRGFITQRELGTILRNLGYYPSNAELRQIIRQVAPPDCNTIDFTDYLIMMNNLKGNADQEEKHIREAFKIIDKDGNGFISAAELRHVMVNLGEKISDADSFDMIDQADTDANGQVDVEEFIRLMRKPLPPDEPDGKESKKE